MNAIYIIILLVVIIVIVLIIIAFTNNTNTCNNFKKNNFKKHKKNNQPSIPNGCYEPIWGVNSVGYQLTNFPSIENYSYLSYNNNLMNTDPQNIPYEFGSFIQDN